jgi:PIN domain nuclease of toxin-antitoxin system
MLIFDTHVWIWLINGDKKITESGLLPAINRAVRDQGIKIPAICAWEVSMLAAKGRITLIGNTLDWIKSALSAPGIDLYPLTPEVAYESSNLPGDFHGDPADRIIVANARIVQGTLLTFDQKILDYAESGYVNVLKPAR